MTLIMRAASPTVRVIGPIVSCDCEIGITPARLTSPTVGLNPTTPLTDAGHVIEPSVSVPSAADASPDATAAADPELEPHGLYAGFLPLNVCPPRLLHPLVALLPRKFAHSLKLVLPYMSACASCIFFTAGESAAGTFAAIASEPAVVAIPCVSMLSLTKITAPCSSAFFPRLPSRSVACASACGSVTMIACVPPSMRSRASRRAR